MMKKTIQLLSVSFIALSSLFITSCKKASTDAAGNQELTPGKSEVRFNYSGAQSGSFQSAIATSTAISAGALTQITSTVISGLTAKSVQIIFPTSIALGTTTQASAGADLTNGFLMSFSTSGGAGWAIGGGTGSGFSVTVTKNTGTEMEGTFSGELGNDGDPGKVTLASGYFHCKL